MNIDIAKRHGAFGAEELVNIAFVDEGDYETEAIELAKRDLLSGGITSQTAYEEILARAREETAQTQEETAEALTTRNAAPLETSDKILFFILGMFPIPLVPAIASIYIISQRNKREQKRQVSPSCGFSLGSALRSEP